MSIYKYFKATKSRQPPESFKLGGKVYRYRFADKFYEDAANTASKLRKQGFFVKIIKVQTAGHPVGKTKLRFFPWYHVYTAPKVSAPAKRIRATSPTRQQAG
jgi:hypothetical protein